MTIYNLRFKRKEFAKNFLGPIMLEFCDNLHMFINSYDKNDTLVLFVSRDGLRIRYIYELYLKLNNFKIPDNLENIFISRLSVINGCLDRNLNFTSEVLKYVFDRITVKDFFRIFLSSNFYNISRKILESKMSTELFKEFYFSKEHYGKNLRDHFKIQSKYFKEYINKITINKKNIILIDTGWQGSSQAILMKTFKEKNWIGLYFGKWDYWDNNHKYLNKISGISIKDNKISKNNYRASILYYHNLIEEPLEAKIQSVERYIKKKNKIIPFEKIDLSKVKPQKDNDEYFIGIIEYFKENKGLSSLKIRKNADYSYKILSKKILFPSNKDIDIMSINPRPSDFKKNVFLRPLKEDRVIKGLIAKKINIAKSLWRQVQIKYEFPIIWPIILLLFYLYTIRKGKILFK